MNRRDGTDSTPKKRTLKLDEELAKDAITKSGRKVRRPAHLESPERTPTSPLAGTRKSVAQKAGVVEDSAGISKSGRKIKVPAKLMEFESELPSSPRKTADLEHESPKAKQTKTPGRPPRLAAKQPDAEGPKERTAPKTPARRGKSVIPETEEHEKGTIARTPGRRVGKSLLDKKTGASEREESPVPEQQFQPKTPGRRVTSALRAESPAPAEQAPPKTPGRRAKSVAPTKAKVDASETEIKKGAKAAQTPGRRAKSPAPEQATPKTPGRRAGKSLANPELAALRGEATTPGRRAKSIAPGKLEVYEEREATPKSVKKAGPGRPAGRKVVKDSTVSSPDVKNNTGTPTKAPLITVSVASEEALSRSGRKIKPKVMFGTEADEMQSTATKEPTPVVALGRKRKVDAVDESTIETMMSPSKKRNTGDVHTPRQRKQNESTTISGTPQLDGAGVSRSGRKIKPKKMFGFEDGETEPFDDVVGSTSPALSEEADDDKGGIDQKKNVARPARSAATVAKGTPTKRATVSVRNRSGFEEKIITKRDVDDHHQEAEMASNKQQLLTDEPDRAMTMNVTSEPLIIRTSIGFGRPSALKKTPPENVEVAPKNESEPGTTIVVSKRDEAPLEPDVENQSEANGSSRSGRKIKPKKFFDADEETTAAHQPVVATKGRKSIAVVHPPMTAASNAKKTVGKDEILAVVSSIAVAGIEDEQSPEAKVVVTSEKADVSAVVTDIAEGPAQLSEAIEEPGQQDDNIIMPDDQEKVMTNEDANTMEVEPEEADVLGAPTQEKTPDEGMEITEGTEQVQDESVSQTLEECAEQVLENQPPNDGQEPRILEEMTLDAENISIATDSVGLQEPVVDQPAEETTTSEHASSTEPKDRSVNEEEVVTDRFAEVGSAEPKDRSVNEEEVVTDRFAEVGSADGADGKQADEPVASETVLEKSTLTADAVPEKLNLSSGSTIAPLKLSDDDDDERIEEASFGEIEYLDQYANDVVQHIKKPSPEHRPTEAPATDPEPKMNETYSPVKQQTPASSSSIIDITVDTPRPVGATVPRTPETKPNGQSGNNDTCSPDKPPEIIEILDSPAVAAFCSQLNAGAIATVGAGSGSATSTPMAAGRLLANKATTDSQVDVQDIEQDNEQEDEHEEEEPGKQQQHEGRKRSLSASAADTTLRRNVTFHSPANCTMFVETIDERLMLKGLQDQQQQRHATNETTGTPSIGEKLRKPAPRKRSLSEHKPALGVKRSKLLDFKKIHAQGFQRMESITEFMKRKEQRGKVMRTAASPATRKLARPTTAAETTGETAVVPSTETKAAPASSSIPFLFKSAGGKIPVPVCSTAATTKEAPSAAKSGTGTTVGRPALFATSAAKKPTVNDTERMEKRMKQFQSTFKPKQLAVEHSTSPAQAAGGGSAADRPVQQLRTKQSKILKGVRTNRRFELQMKHRDNAQHQ